MALLNQPRPPGRDGASPGRAAGVADAGAGGGLSFPDAPRLELDQLLHQLTDRAGDVLASQGRLRGLLRANATVAADLSLPVVLRRMVEAARELLDARYAALGVIGRDGVLEQFVHSGMDTDLVDRIGELPTGQGILGLLISQSGPIRLAELSAHQDSVGFPGGHPPMGSFLGVPIRVGGEVFGNLYLTERVGGGQFSIDDEELAVALAAATGAAIANARLFAESEQRRRWLAAAGELARRLSADGGQSLELIIDEAAGAADADFAILALPDGDGGLTVRAARGAAAQQLLGSTTPLEDSLSGQAIQTGKALLVTDEAAEPLAVAVGAAIGALIVVPLAAGEKVRGALSLGRLATRPSFTEADLLMAADFGNHAAVGLELLDARADQLALARFEDHDRIARDLHDHVIQELFTASMGLQGLATVVGRSHAERLRAHVHALDQVITQIRSTIFQLQPGQHDLGGLRARLLDVVSEHSPQLGSTAQVRFSGPLDSAVGESPLAEDILGAAREALSNCAGHARATNVEIALSLTGDLITLEVTDDGRGIGASEGSGGLAHLRQRAVHHGGTLHLTDARAGGTHLTWTARLPE